MKSAPGQDVPPRQDAAAGRVLAHIQKSLNFKRRAHVLHGEFPIFPFLGRTRTIKAHARHWGAHPLDAHKPHPFTPFKLHPLSCRQRGATWRRHRYANHVY